MSAAKSVTATFEPQGGAQVYPLAVAKAGNGEGTVTGSPGAIDCGAAAKGSSFARWSGACFGTASTCKVTMTEARSVTATFTVPPSGASSSSASCLVPKPKGKSLGQARTALTAAHCALGKVSKPKARKGHKLGPLVVRSSSPGVGSTLPAGGKVDLKLAKAHKRAHKRRHG